MFKAVDNKIDFPKMEHRILGYWEDTDAFRKLVEQNRGNEKWSFIDGPITANNPMGLHHGWGRTFKDMFQRYHAMKGHDLRWQNGFDCQGLWVEVEVEKELGFNSKREIEAYGVDRFAHACRARVLKYADIITRQSKRLGQWNDWENSYYTMSDTNNEYIWYFLNKCQENGWLYRGDRSTAWCWRCGTSLSQHEIVGTDSYHEVTHSSVFVLFPLTTPGHGGENLLVWTTTPWTLAANVAAAVHPDLDYAKVRQGDRVIYLSRGTLGRLVGAFDDLGTVKGRDLVGLTYRGPFDDLPAPAAVLEPTGQYTHRVIPWDAVGEEEGTGIVHIAPGCGSEDFDLSRVNSLPVLVPLDENGVYGPKYGVLAGQHVAGVAPLVFEELEKRGVLYNVEEYTHRYPFCWRCGTDVVWRVNNDWYISVQELRPRMLKAASEVDWTPDYAGKRMENWLHNMSDWNISRKRYWGLALPFYVCDDCGEVTVAKSVAQLRELAVNPEVVDNLPELHRPWIDEVKIKCPKCESVVSRIPEVGDAWLDAGIVPFSTLKYLDDPEYWRKWFPADWVSEMREQIRLWFYSMLIMSVTLEDTSPYKAVLTYEKVHDEHGRPMHKSWGNAIWFDDAAEKMGADVMRWLYCSANTRENMNFGWALADGVKRNLLTLWNTYSFFVMYANLDGFVPEKATVPLAERAELDRWILARLHDLLAQARVELDQYDVASVCRRVEGFVDDLSNWYVRRSRRRFWKSESDSDKLAAYSTLYEVLLTLTKMIAPMMPFLAEEIYQNLVKSDGRNPDAPESVHHCAYPEADESLIDRELLADVSMTQRLVSLGRAARNKASVKVRQPLSEIMVRLPNRGDEESLARTVTQILEELNVKKLTVTNQIGDLITYSIKPNFAVMGPKYGKKMGAIREALGKLDPAEVAAQVETGTGVSVGLADGETLELQPDELLVETREREGFAVAQEGGLVVALDTELDDALLQEGMARDFVRIINDMRKSADFSVSDRIATYYTLQGPDDANRKLVEGALSTFADYIKTETLTKDLQVGEPPEGAYTQDEAVGSTFVKLAVVR
ncbi:MAG TPA: isoleucine--tRNA ligase [Chloroflexia bacterium]|nr:isoleucine--tRNA ligase [Chloroflexia bacterium]